MFRFIIETRAALRKINVNVFNIAFISGRIVTSKASKSSTPGMPAKMPIAPISTMDKIIIMGL